MAPNPNRAGETGPYHSLIDAEREAAGLAGGPQDKIALIKGLREATGLDLRRAKEAVEAYLGQRVVVAGGRAGWVDDFLDAEREAAAREDRPVTRIMLVKALRHSSAGLDLRDSDLAVRDYLRRRGANLPSGGVPTATTLVVLAVVAGLALILFLVAR